MKTVKEWLMQLPEPYKTQCLEAALYYDAIDDMRGSLATAIAMSIPSWPGLDTEDLIKRANSGEFDKPSIPWPDEAKWENAPKWAYARACDMDGYCYFYGVVARGKEYEPAHRSCGKIANMTGIDWETSLETRPK